MRNSDIVVSMIREGKSYNAISQVTGLTQSTISYHASKAGLARKRTTSKPTRYDWCAVQTYYDQGHTMEQCVEYFGFCVESWCKARRRGDIEIRGAMSIEELTTGERSRGHLKRRLTKAGILAEVCNICGISEWQGNKLSLQLDHIDGNNKNNLVDNLRLLCPNCHSQTDTFCGKNVKRSK